MDANEAKRLGIPKSIFKKVISNCQCYDVIPVTLEGFWLLWGLIMEVKTALENPDTWKLYDAVSEWAYKGTNPDYEITGYEAIP